MAAAPRLPRIALLALGALSCGLVNSACSRSHGPRRAPIVVEVDASGATAPAAIDAGQRERETEAAVDAARVVDAAFDAAVDAAIDAALDAETFDACPSCEVDVDAPDAAPTCGDLDLCALGSLDPNTGICVHTPALCMDDGIDCTSEVCDPDLGCEHVLNHASCYAADPCGSSECDPEQGCVSVPFGDGHSCGEARCGQQYECMAGACVAKGTRDPACDRWFTPGDSGMLPWSEQACGADYGDGLVPGGLDDSGTYTWSSPKLFASEELVFAPRYYAEEGLLRFDGAQWSALPALQLPQGQLSRWTPLTLRGSELLLATRDDVTGCPLALLLDITTGAARPYAEGMAEAPLCVRAGNPALTPIRVRAGEDGSLWSFTNLGLFKFEQSAWQDQGLPDVPAGEIGDVAIDADGVEWVIGGREHYLWTRVDHVWQAVDLPPLKPASVVTHVFNSRGHLLFNTEDTVLARTEHGIVQYPTITKPGGGISQVAADEFGRPIVRVGDYGIYLAIFDGSGWADAGYADALANDAQYRVYVAHGGRVARLAGTTRLPLGPEQRHLSFSAGTTLSPYQLSMQAGPSLDWMPSVWNPQREAHEPVTISLEQKTQRANEWQASSVEVVVPAAEVPLSTRGPTVLRRFGNKRIVALRGSALMLVEGESAQPITFASGGLLQYGFAMALAADGRILFAYHDAAGAVLRLAHLQGAVLVDDRVVAQVAAAPTALELAVAQDGLMVLWVADPGDGTPHSFARLWTGAAWRDLPAPPPGSAVVDARGRVWRTGFGSSSTSGPNFMELSFWDGSAWQVLPGGRVEGAVADGLAFDRASNPVVLTRSGMALQVARYQNGAFHLLTDTAGGINNSPCNMPHAPQIASDGQLVCVSWLEAADAPSELMLRCLKLE